MRHQLPPLDFTSLEGSLADMLESLQEAERNALEPALPGIQVSTRVTGVRGRPRVDINKEYFEHVLGIRGPYELTDVFKCSARTIRRRAVEYGFRTPGNAPFQNMELPDGTVARRWVSAGKRERSAISDNAEALDTVVGRVLATFPGFGRCKVDGALRAQGIRIPRDRLIASIERVSGPSARFKRPIIQRRAYYVPAVNSLWHHDGNHGRPCHMSYDLVLIIATELIRWRLICHVFIDGKTRLVTGARFHHNNRADTVLDLFKDAISVHGLPSRVRGDHGTENVRVADYMDEKRGLGRGSYIWGRYVYFNRITVLNTTFDQICA